MTLELGSKCMSQTLSWSSLRETVSPVRSIRCSSSFSSMDVKLTSTLPQVTRRVRRFKVRLPALTCSDTRSHARSQLLVRDRFDHIVVGPRVESAHDRLRIAES